MFGGLRLILFLYIWCFMQNQSENALKVCKHNILINGFHASVSLSCLQQIRNVNDRR